MALCSSIGAFLCSSTLILLGLGSALLAFALAIVLLVISNIYKKSLIDKLEEYMNRTIKDYDNLPKSPVTIFWNELQQKVKHIKKDDYNLIFDLERVLWIR